MAYIVTGDIHIKSGRKKLKENLDHTAELICTLAGHEDVVVLNGDITDTPGYIDAETGDLLYSFLEKISESDCNQIFINVGNHDASTKDATLHNLSLTGFVPRAEVVGLGDFDGPCVPYTPDALYLRNYFTKPNLSLSRFRFLHCPVEGISFGGGVVETHGVPIDVVRESGDFIILSHYHQKAVYRPQYTPLHDLWRSSGSTVVLLHPGDILTIGAPFAHSYSDKETEYGVWSLQGAGVVGEARFHPNRHSKIYSVVRASTPSELTAGLSKCVPGDNSCVSIHYSGKPEEINEKAALELFSSESKIRFVNTTRTKNKGTKQDVLIGAEAGAEHFLGAYLRYVEESAVFEPNQIPFVQDVLSNSFDQLIIDDQFYGKEMIFESVSLRNFMSWEAVRLEFDSLGTVTSVVGDNADADFCDSNGSGKTSLLESIVWCIYNKTLRGIEYSDNVIRSGKSSMSVELTFSVGDQRYSFRRSRERGKSGSFDVFKETNTSTHLFENITRTGQGAAEKQVLEIIGMPYDVFISTVFFSSGFDGRFTSFTDSQKKRYVSRLLGLGIYEKIRTGPLTEIKEAKIKELEEMNLLLRVTESKLAEIPEKKEEISGQNATLKIESLGLSEDLEEVKGHLSNTESSLLKLEKTLESIVAERDRIVDEKKQAFSGLFARERSLTGEINRAPIKYALDDLLSQQRVLKTKIADLRKLMNRDTERCPTCFQKIAGDHDADSLVSITFSLEQSEDALSLLEAEHQQKSEALQKELDELRSEKATLAKQVNEVDFNAPKEITDKILGLTDVSQGLRRAAKEYREKIEVINRKIWECGVQIEHNEKQLGLLDFKIEEYQQKASMTRQNVESLETLFKVISRINDSLGVSGIIGYLTSSFIDQVNLQLADISKLMLGSDYSVLISNVSSTKLGDEKDKISLVVTTGGEAFFNSSDGEQRKMDIAIHLSIVSTLASLGIFRCNLLIADQIFDNSLDNKASATVFEAVKDYANREDKKVIVISHHQAFSGFADTTLLVRKRQGVSTMTRM